MPLIEHLFEKGLDAEGVRRALVEHSERVGGLGSWAWDLTTGRLAWSDNMFRLLDLEPGEIEPSLEYLASRLHPEDRATLAQAADAARAGQSSPGSVYRVLTRAGHLRHLEVGLRLQTTAGGRTIALGIVRDITAARLAEREIAAHVAVTKVLSDWEGLELSGRTLLAELATALGFSLAVLWTPTGDELAARLAWPEKTAALRELRLGPGRGLAGSAWRSRKPISCVRADHEIGYEFRDQAQQSGLRGATAIPLISGDEVLGVIGLAGPQDLEVTERLTATLTGIGHEVGTFLGHHLGELSAPALSPRELEVLRLAAKGLTGPRIAAELHVSPATVKTHFEHIYRKYGVDGRSAAVAKAVREGLIR